MSESELQNIEDESPDFDGDADRRLSSEGDRRKEVRRVTKDRRDMIRYEVKSGDRRSGNELRQVKLATKVRNDIEDDDDIEVEDESVLDSVIGKIGSIFKR